MSMITRLRDRRHANRRNRAIENAISAAKTPELRHGIRTLLTHSIR